jgi:hypothetical protein
MNKGKKIVAGTLIFGGLLAFASPASAYHYRRERFRENRQELREDLRDLREARREYRRDLRNGAGPRELARDRAAIRREQREVWHDSREVERDQGWWGRWRRGWWE